MGSPQYGFSRGYLVYSEPGKRDVEAETFACGHCTAQTIVKPGQDPASLGGFCRVCAGLLCPRCVGEMRCDTIEAKLERWEASQDARRSYGI